MPKKILQRLAIALAQVKAGNTSENLLNEIRQIIQGGPQKYPYFSLAIIFTKIRKPFSFFLHRYWKFIEFF